MEKQIITNDNLELYKKHTKILMTTASELQQLSMSKYKLEEDLRSIEAAIKENIIESTESNDVVHSIFSEFLIDGYTIIGIDSKTNEIIYNKL